MKKINKKAATGATITWVVALIIIAFILFIFILATLVITKDKKTIRVSKEVEYLQDDTVLTEKLIFYLNFPAGFDREELLIDKIFENIDIYLDYEKDGKSFFGEEEFIQEFDLYEIKTWKRAREFYGDDFFTNINFLQKELDLILAIQNVLSPSCEDYIFKIPQGAIRGNVIFGATFVQEWEAMKEMGDLEWTDWVMIKIPYKEQIIKIKYRQLKKC
tara:strand:- start:648 stop:1298 length:651 start_codon:yes stop_codon:yes gene_type:complete